MAEVTVRDLLEDASYTRDTSGVRAVRRFLVENLDDVAAKRLYQAALLPDVPQFGTPHESIPNLVVNSVDVVPAPSSPSKALITVTYGSPEQDNQEPSETAQPTVEVGATVSEIETSRDKDGNEMLLDHTIPAHVDENGTLIADQVLPTQPAKVSVQEAHPYVTCERREPDPFYTAKVLAYVNHVNSVAWFGSQPRQWLCTAIRARLDGDSFVVSYEFQFRERTWDVQAVYTNPTTGAPVEDPIEEVGIKRFQVYPEADFNGLNLGVLA
jgi:hypothetical protein